MSTSPPPQQPPRRPPAGGRPPGGPGGPAGPAAAKPAGKKRKRKVRTGWRRYTPTWRMVWVTCLSGFLLLTAAVAYLWFSTPIPKPSEVATSQATTVLYSDGSVLGTIGGTTRRDVTLDQVPVVVQHAVLAAEDRKFYSESGISVTGIARAVLVDLSGGSVQGGSTITQQYAKNAYLTQKRTLSRKLREAVIAVKLAHTRSHDQVLQDYLNTIYFGRGASGIQAAAKAYFGVDVSKLTAPEGAVLAAVINRPSYLDPDVHPAAAKLRYDYVMKGMVKEGWLPAALPFPTKQVIKYVPVRVTGPNAFIIDAVEKELAGASSFDDQQLADGVTIVTTIDKNDQKAAIQAQDDQLNSKVAKLKTKNPPVGALVAMQPSDGAIRAMYGGQGSTDGDCSVRDGGCLNLATQGTFQPGSSFKPYVLTAAEEQGSDGILSRWDGPAVLKDPPGPDVHNDSKETCFGCTLSKALAQSINTIYVPLAKKVGPSSVALVANRAGIPETLSDNGVTSDRVALGVYPVHPIDQADGYATLCNGGRQVKPFLVRSVKDSKGTTLYRASVKATAKFDPKIMSDVDYAMQQVVISGTAQAAQLGNRPVAGKTGTTQNNTNAWFIGCTGPAQNTGQLVTAVWVGHAATVTPLTDIPGFESGVFGGTIPAEIFHEFMTVAMNGKPVVQFPAPSYVAGPKPAGTTTPTPTVTTATPKPTKTTPKPTKTTPKPILTTSAAATTTVAPPPATTAAPPPPTQAPVVTTTVAPPVTTSVAPLAATTAAAAGAAAVTSPGAPGG